MAADTASLIAAEPNVSQNISFNKTPQGCVVIHIKTDHVYLIYTYFVALLLDAESAFHKNKTNF